HWIGKKLGPYLIQRELASGGMGRVFAAVRSDGEFDISVAIKILRAGIDTPEGRRRFHLERQTLASLTHPNIARLLDGGVVEGLPYFVMEYVDGLPIDDYCAQHSLGLHERLNLMLTICDAVAATHYNLIIHRDIKPSNILVTEEGVPK